MAGVLALGLGAAGACDPGLGVDPGWSDAPLPSPGDPVSDSMANVGAELFRRNCAACHSLGGGDVVGPDLSGVTTRRPVTWIRGMVSRPDSMLRVDGVAQALLRQYQVPMLNRELDEARVRAILEFLWRADHPPDGAVRPDG
ncbi:MAG: cytochrome c [Gemmatimonadota bacterium]